MQRFNGIDIRPYLGLQEKNKSARRSGTFENTTTGAYVVNLKGRSSVCSLDLPAPTLTTQPHLGLAQPVMVSMVASDLAADPLVEAANPFLVGIDHQGGNGSCVNAVDRPLTTITTKPRHGLVNAFIVGAGGPARAGEPRLIDKPLNTVLTRQSMALIDPTIVAGESFIVAAGGPEGKGRTAKSLSRPLETILTENHDGLVQPYIVAVNHEDNSPKSGRCHSIEKPLPTVTTHNGYGIVSSYLTKYYGTATVQPVTKPLDTVTTRPRFGLVEPVVREGPATENPQLPHLIPLGNGLFLDIRFRMLKNHELAGAMSFPKNYVFVGKQAKVAKQIGNAVPTRTAKALCRERLQRYAKGITPPPVAA
jgi:DNA (cytosine-5)-methyltransferase 1